MSEKVLITPAELAEQIKSPGIVLIDTRNSKSYEAGHLPGAVNIHDIFTYLATSTPEGVSAMRDKFAGIFGGRATHRCRSRRVCLTQASRQRPRREEPAVPRAPPSDGTVSPRRRGNIAGSYLDGAA